MKKKPIQITIQNKGDKKAEVLIYDTIGAGWLGGISAQDFAKDIKALGDVEEINVRINSEGGNVFDGVTIYNTLVSHKARITVDIDGLAASIASIIAMAGDTVRIAENAMFMIHDPWIVAAGNSADLREQADLLDKVRDQLVLTYKNRSNADEKTIGDLMTAETWMTAQEAFDYGFVDEVTGALKIAAHIHKERFKNAPQALTSIGDAGIIEHKAVASDSLLQMRARLALHKL